MENQNVIGQPSQGDSLSAVKAIFADYKSGDNNNNKPAKLTKEEILGKYFTPRNEKEYFRILPPLPGRKHIETAFFHVVKVNIPGGKKKWRKIYCPTHNDPKVQKLDANQNPVLDSNDKPFMVPKKCPLCEKAKSILATQDQSIRNIKLEDMTEEQKKIKKRNDEIYKEAMAWEAKKFYIIRGIDRGNTGHGVKFWRFKHNYKKQGVKDKLIPILENFVEQFQIDFADPKSGTDLIISVVDNKIPGSDRTFKDVSTIFLKGQTELTPDPIIYNQWVNDNTTWRDVFKPAKAPGLTSDEYLERITRGVDPYWDETDPNNKKWVFPDPNDIHLQEKANARDQNLGSVNNTERNVEQASDLVTQSYTNNVTIQNVTSDDVGQYNDGSDDVGNEMVSQNENPTSVNQEQPVTESGIDNSEYDNYDDLPF